jgi:hypothetical protein
VSAVNEGFVVCPFPYCNEQTFMMQSARAPFHRETEGISLEFPGTVTRANTHGPSIDSGTLRSFPWVALCETFVGSGSTGSSGCDSRKEGG